MKNNMVLTDEDIDFLFDLEIKLQGQANRKKPRIKDQITEDEFEKYYSIMEKLFKETNRRKVVRLFTERNDEEALKRLYSIDYDPLIQLALNWYKGIDKATEGERQYYRDLISYIWDKYELSRK